MKAVPLNLQPDIENNWDFAPGALTQMSNFIPKRRGSYASLAAHVDQTSVASYARTTYPVAAGMVRLPDNTVRVFAFEKQAIYELTNTTTAVDRSKGGGYSASTTTWTWTMFGAACIATNKLDAPQVSSSGAFADLSATAPKGQCVVSQLGFVLLFNINDGTDKPDGWACSPIENPTGVWTPSLSTQAASGRLYDTPGPITAACALRDSVVVFKQDSIYVGDYVLDTVNGIIWGFRLISDKVGCSSPHGVAFLNDKLYFIHRTNVYEFDGSTCRPIGNAVANKYLGTGLSQDVYPYMQAFVDQGESLVGWALPLSASSSTKLTAGLSYNTITGKFGPIGATAMKASGVAGTDFYASCVMKATLNDLYSFSTTYSDPRTMLFMGKQSATNVGLWMGLYTATGLPAAHADTSASFTTGAIGDGSYGQRMIKVRPRFVKYVANDQDSTPTCTAYGSKNEADLFANSNTHPVSFTWNSNEYCFDGVTQDRYIWLTLAFDGPVEISGLAIDVLPSASK